jgi:hypothetical protein
MAFSPFPGPQLKRDRLLTFAHFYWWCVDVVWSGHSFVIFWIDLEEEKKRRRRMLVGLWTLNQVMVAMEVKVENSVALCVF